MGHWKRGPAVEQNFDYFVIVPVGRQHQRRYVRREGGRLGGDGLPTLKRFRGTSIDDCSKGMGFVESLIGITSCTKLEKKI